MAEGILGEIASAKRLELRSRFDGVSLDALRDRAEPTRRSLTAALARDGARFILEIKRASPSEGAIRKGADPAALARGYAGVADALSVLCDRAYFGGSLEDLAAARREFDGPILAKDFFIDLRQVAEARIAGADAILVMLSLLDDSDARAMIGEARSLGMDALVEVHDRTEMRRALALGAPLIGINNRDLRDLSVDLATTERLAKLAPDTLKLNVVTLHGISFFNQDLEAAPPADWVKFREMLQASDAVLFVTPEYNRAISGVLKNAIDVGSRPYGKSSFNGKPTGIISNSPGPLGGVSAAKTLQNVLPGISGPIMQQPEMYLNNVGDAFGDKGSLIKESLQQVLKQYIDAFAVFVERHHR